jgi:hypothetical protein
MYTKNHAEARKKCTQKKGEASWAQVRRNDPNAAFPRAEGRSRRVGRQAARRAITIGGAAAASSAGARGQRETAAALIGRKVSGFTGGQLSNVQTGAKSGARILSSKNYPSAITGDAYVQACQLTFGRGVRGLRAVSVIWTHPLKYGCRAAQTSIAHDMPRSSCCPGGQV